MGSTSSEGQAHFTGPSPQEAEAIASVEFRAEVFSGPLPHPSLLAKYNEVIPNGAERILAMAERQSAHRESLEAQVVAANLASQRRGSNYAFCLALVVILGGIYLMATGKNAWGFAAILTSLVSLLSVFLVARQEQRRERVQKSAALQSRQSR